MKQNNIYKKIIILIILSLVLIMFIILAFRSFSQNKSAELMQISCDKRAESTINNAQEPIISDKVNTTNTSICFDNITDPLVCIQQWQENNMSLENAVLCIDKSMRSRNET